MPNVIRKQFFGTTTWTVPAGVTKARFIGDNPFLRRFSMTGKFTEIIQADGNMYALGENANGQLGVNTSTDIGSTPLVVVGTKTWKHVLVPALNNTYNCFGIDQAGDMYAWGQNTNFIGGGLLGLGNVTAAFSSPQLVAGSHKWTRVFQGPNGASTYAIDTNGVMWAWGYNSSPLSTLALGADNQLMKSTPTLVTGGKKWREVCQSINGPTVGIDSDGNAWSWGSNQLAIGGTFATPVLVGGALGNGNPTAAAYESTPVLVSGSHKWKKIVGGAAVIDVGFGIPVSCYFIGIDENGTLWGWGVTTQSLAPNGLAAGAPGNSGVSTPVLVLGTTKKFVDIAMTVAGGFGTTTIYGLTTEGEIYAWGNNPYPLGVWPVPQKSTPTLVVGGKTWSQLVFPVMSSSLGTEFGGAIDVNGDLYAWGDANSDPLGTGETTTSVSSPRIVLGSKRFTQVINCCVDENRWLGFTTTGDMYQWGAIYSGSGFYNLTSSPVIVVGTHQPDPRNAQEVMILDVKPGQVIPIEMSGIYAAVNGITFAKLPNRVIVEYER